MYKLVVGQIEGKDTPPSITEVHERLLNHEAKLLASRDVSPTVVPTIANVVQHRQQNNYQTNYRNNNKRYNNTSYNNVGIN